MTATFKFRVEALTLAMPWDEGQGELHLKHVLLVVIRFDKSLISVYNCIAGHGACKSPVCCNYQQMSQNLMAMTKLSPKCTTWINTIRKT